MHLFQFSSTAVTALSALTVDGSGGNLPSKHGPWQRDGAGVIPVDQSGNAILAALHRDGYCLLASEGVAINGAGFGRSEALARDMLNQIEFADVGPAVALSALQMLVLNVLHSLDGTGEELEDFVEKLRYFGAELRRTVPVCRQDLH